MALDRPGTQLFLALIVLCAMASGIMHSNLFGSDEAREAEIARETVADNHWITPHLCGLPFLEKPPLYYDAVAACFAVAGKRTPSLARFVSVLFGLGMIASVFWFGFVWGGTRQAWLSVLSLLSLPAFFYFSHLILLDIAVGLFCTLAMAIFAVWFLQPAEEKGRILLLYAFYFVCALCFLSKGIVAIFHIGVVLGAFLLIRRDWRTALALLSPLPLLLFFAPVALWVFLYYREGGVAYLYEHFVNNTIGRILHIQFKLPDGGFNHTDVGTVKPWGYYFTHIVSVIGAMILVLPFALWDKRRQLVQSVRETNGQISPQVHLWLLVAIWAFLPGILLSFASTKQTSYIIPSYAAVALIIGSWLESRMPSDQRLNLRWLLVLPVAATYSILQGEAKLKPFLIPPIIGVCVLITVLAVLAWKKSIHNFLPLSFATVIGVVIIMHSPVVLNLSEKNYRTTTAEVISRVGGEPLYLLKPTDSFRGVFAFTMNRLTPELDQLPDVDKVISSRDKFFLLMPESVYIKFNNDPALAGCCTRVPLSESERTTRQPTPVLLSCDSKTSKSQTNP